MRGNRAKKIVAIVAVLAIMVVLAGVVCLHMVVEFLLLSARGTHDRAYIEGVATVSNPVISPSGKYQLRVIPLRMEEGEHEKFAIFRVSDGEPEASAIFTADDAYRIRDALFFVWDDQDRVWVYSGDVGAYFWERVSDGNWQKHEWADYRSVPVPPLLKELRPRYFGSD